MTAYNAGVRHIGPTPPAGQWIIAIGLGNKHTASGDCLCEPKRVVTTKRTSTGRYGRHQGHNSSVAYHHNELPGDYPAKKED